MEWNQNEVELAAVIAADIERCLLSRNAIFDENTTIVIPPSSPDMYDDPATRRLPIRHLLNKMGFDEHRVFRWRMEHKLLHVLVLSYYCSDCVPVTRGLGRELSAAHPEDYPRLLADLQSLGYLVKPTLGFASGERCAVDYLPHFRRESEDNPNALRSFTDLFVAANAWHTGRNTWTSAQATQLLSHERFVIQQRINITKEFRVHTFEGRVVPGLTSGRHTLHVSREENLSANHFVQEILDRLPAGVIAGTLYGWDVAQSANGTMFVIELNPTGMHPEYKPGFQCSGFLSDHVYGAAATAKLFAWVAEQYGITIRMDIADLYKIGNVDRQRLDGALDYVEEVNMEPQHQSLRIDPKALEAHLAGHPEIQEVMVRARQEASGVKTLAAYYVQIGGTAASAGSLQAYLQGMAAEFILPSEYTAVDALPSEM